LHVLRGQMMLTNHHGLGVPPTMRPAMILRTKQRFCVTPKIG